MIDRKITMRYVRGLIEAASHQNCIDVVGKALKSFDSIISQHGDVIDIIYNPTVACERKKKFVSGLLPAESPELLGRFLDYVIEKKREKILESVSKEYIIAADALQGIIRAKVVSAMELTEKQVSRLKKEIEGVLQLRVVLECEIDPNILGGVKVYMGTNVIDGSVTGRLDSFQKHLLSRIGQLKTAA